MLRKLLLEHTAAVAAAETKATRWCSATKNTPGHKTFTPGHKTFCPHKIRGDPAGKHASVLCRTLTVLCVQLQIANCLEFDDKLRCTPWNVGRENKRSCCLRLVCSRTSLLVRGFCSLQCCTAVACSRFETVKMAEQIKHTLHTHRVPPACESSLSLACSLSQAMSVFLGYRIKLPALHTILLASSHPARHIVEYKLHKLHTYM